MNSIKSFFSSLFSSEDKNKDEEVLAESYSVAQFLDNNHVINLTPSDIEIGDYLLIGAGKKRSASLLLDEGSVSVINLPKYERYSIIYIVSEDVAGFAGIWLKRDDVAYIKEIDGITHLILPATGKIFPKLKEGVFKEGRCVRHLKTWGEYRIFLSPERFILEGSGERLYGYRP